MSDYTLAQAVSLTGIPKTQLERIIFEGQIELRDGLIPEEDVNLLNEENDIYIGLCEYSLMHDSDTFHGSKSTDRNNLLKELELNDFFGLDITLSKNLLSGNARNKLYFFRSDIPFLEEKLSTFFWGYAMPEQDKVEYLLSHDTKHPTTCRVIREYQELMMFEQSVTPAFTEAVQALLQAPDILKLKNENITQMLSLDSTVSAKNYVVDILSFARQRNKVKYSTIVRPKQESIMIQAYSTETYLFLAQTIFNPKYIAEHHMIEKALDDHICAEMWLYLSLFYTCGWRAGDVCRGWVYPNWSDKEAPAEISIETLADDIRHDRLPEQVYEDVCEKAMRDINVAERLPGKTSAHAPRSLDIIISSALRPFYGLLTLIGEAHHLRTGDGYMQQRRMATYQMNQRLREFFGEEINDVLHGQNLQTRRMNKDFLQAVEEEARKDGNGFLCSAVASYARNHVSLQSIRTYLKDHQMTGETAEVVLYFMLERGAFGIEYYQALTTAYPDVMKSLPIKEQNKLIVMMKEEVTPLSAEMNLSAALTADHVSSQFISGDEKAVLTILEAMYEITQDRGKGKDSGVYCFRRARGEACINPASESCISCCCPELVFTQLGYKPLLSVLLNYKNKAKSGDKKAEGVLNKVLIPRYQRIINELMKSYRMAREDRIGLKLMLEDTLNE